jgi:hypothetical protein
MYIERGDMIRGNIKGSVRSNEVIACARHDFFLKKVRMTLCVLLEYEAEKGLSVVLL